MFPVKMEQAEYLEQRIAAAVAAAVANMQVPAPVVPAAAAAAHVGAVGIKLPEFWVADPDMWFFQAEAAFRRSNITAERTKFDHVVMRLPAEVSISLRSFLLAVTDETVAPYTELKGQLTSAFGKTRWQRAFAILDHPELGDRRPSRMMGDLLALLPPEDRPDTLFLAHFLRRLPGSMRDHLAAANHTTAQQMAAHADLLWDSRSVQGVSSVEDSIEAISNRSASPGRGRSPDRQQQKGEWKPRNQTPHGDGRQRGGKWCVNHKKYGRRAKNCIAPCAFIPEN
jgi:hypothetical protein